MRSAWDPRIITINFVNIIAILLLSRCSVRWWSFYGWATGFWFCWRWLLSAALFAALSHWVLCNSLNNPPLPHPKNDRSNRITRFNTMSLVVLFRMDDCMDAMVLSVHPLTEEFKEEAQHVDWRERSKKYQLGEDDRLDIGWSNYHPESGQFNCDIVAVIVLLMWVDANSSECRVDKFIYTRVLYEIVNVLFRNTIHPQLSIYYDDIILWCIRGWLGLTHASQRDMHNTRTTDDGPSVQCGHFHLFSPRKFPSFNENRPNKLF